MANQRPIFIVGCPRSGTTMLRLILDAHPNISCGPESGFLTDFHRSIENHWSHLSLYGFEQRYWDEKMADFFATFQAEYATKRGKQRWAEKTPQYTPYMELILRLFPESQIIHIIRDGRDVMASHLNRWGYRAALRGMKQWRQFIDIAQAVGQQLPQAQYVELRYEELVQSPEATLHDLMAYLQEPWDDNLLNFLESDHDIRTTYAEHINQERQRSGDQRSLYNSRVGAWQQDLPLPLKMTFRYWAGSLLRELGYT